jgi:hypothetical protein
MARKQMFLVQHKTAYILILLSLIQQCRAVKIRAGDMRHLTCKELKMWLEEEYLLLSAQVNLDSISFLKLKIQGLEKAMRKKDILYFHCFRLALTSSREIYFALPFAIFVFALKVFFMPFWRFNFSLFI